LSQAFIPPSTVNTGAEVLAASGFAALAGKRIGLITNHTGRVGSVHLADLLSKAPNVKLAAIFAPEHGFRGSVEAGERVGQDWDAKTGAPVFSLYGASRRPTPRMLRDVDALVFDIQDIGVRFYTYISTMGLAMQAAAAARVPFVVLDRPNPLGRPCSEKPRAHAQGAATAPAQDASQCLVVALRVSDDTRPVPTLQDGQRTPFCVRSPNCRYAGIRGGPTVVGVSSRPAIMTTREVAALE
jgi:uncharacterized protein YbbC (DUF1343 family)